MDELKLLDDNSWDLAREVLDRIDPNLRLAVALLAAHDYEQLFRRTGIRVRPDGIVDEQSLPLMLKLKPGEKSGTLAELSEKRGDAAWVDLPMAYRAELSGNPRLTWFCGWLEDWARSPLERGTGADRAGALRKSLRALLEKGLERIALPAPMQPCLEDSVRDIDMPASRQLNGTNLDGSGVVVGIIDDGCAFAHRHFLDPATGRSRIRFLWDSTRANAGAGWTQPADFPGCELKDTAIDAAIGAPGNGRIDEDAVYAKCGYDPGLASHGTHVMDIAAGNGGSLAGTQGVAPGADIIFVQLPTDLVEAGGPLLEDAILKGVTYIFTRAGQLGMPAVVNISYGGYSGPHDGSSPLASGIDERLEGATDRAVVVAAGNGFEADCHASGSLKSGGAGATLRWIVSPEDPTGNLLEIWYDDRAKVDLSITPPGGGAIGPISQGKDQILQHADGRIVGWIHHGRSETRSHLNVIRIFLTATEGEGAPHPAAGNVGQGIVLPPPILTAPARSGTWKLDLSNAGVRDATFHAWIARDDLRRASGKRPQQSRFHEDDADPLSTLADLATGHHSIAVGGHNAATGEMARYSASGPTLDGRNKPEMTAPAEEDATGRGVLCASSRRAQPTRMNGTSAAAPHVAGLVAVMMQYNKAKGGNGLSADDIRRKLVKGCGSAQVLQPPPIRSIGHNRHQDVDAHRPAGKRQADHFQQVTGAGKVNVQETAKNLP